MIKSGNLQKSGILFVLVILFLLVISLASLNTTNAATPLYVNGTSGNDSWDGMSPVYHNGTYGPMKTIQTAVNAVDTGGTVNVADGTYNEHITISKNLNLVGSNANTTIIDGTGSGQVINVAAVSNVNIANFTIRNGASSQGAGIYSLATITLNNCIITGNNATGSGGGIYAAGTTTMNNSIITGNKASNGGGIAYGWNTITIRYSQLTGNTATNGKEIYQVSGSTIDAQYNWWGQNTGPQSGQISGTVTYTPWLYMTLTASPSSILNGTTSQLNASFNNAYNGVTVTSIDPATGHMPNGCVVTFATDLGNVGSKTTTKTTSNGIATATLTADEGLGLANVSAKIDNQNTTTTIRIYDNNLYVNGTSGNDTWDGTSPIYINGTTGPMLTIQTAINAVETGGTVNVAEGTYPEHLTISSKNLNLNGSGQNQTFIDGTLSGSVITINSGMNVNITGVTICNGMSSMGGGIYNYNGGILTITNSTLTGNTAWNQGGAIYTSPGTVIIINSTLTGNTANDGTWYGGGAIFSYAGTLTITNSTLNGNTATNKGGVIYQEYGTLTITNSILTNNNANDGGVIYYNNLAGPLTLHYNRIANNSPNAIWTSALINATENWWGSNDNPSGQFGGSGTVNYSPWLYMTFTADPTLIVNGATSTIAANFNNVYNGTSITSINATLGHLPNNSAVTFTTDLGSVGSDSTIKNTINGIATATLIADEGIGTANLTAQLDNQILNTTVEITNTLYVNGASGNDAWNGLSPTYIGGIIGPMKTIQTAINAVEIGGIVSIANGLYTGVKNTNITIAKSMTIQGQSQEGTIINGTGTNWIFDISSGINVTIKNMTLTNATRSDGGAIYNNGGNLTVTGITFANNTASGMGGAIIHFNGDLTVTDSTFTKNTAVLGGAILTAGFGSLNLTGSTFTGNTASAYGGAIYTDEGSEVHFNRFVGNPDPHGYEIWSSGGSVNATNNWWGSNANPSSLVSGDGTVNYSPWLYMTFTPNPTLILFNGGTSTLNVNFNNAYNGTDITSINPDLGHVPDNSPVTFTTDLGIVGSNTTIKNTLNGVVTAILTSDEQTGLANLTTQLDNQILNATVEIMDTLYVNGTSGNDTWNGFSPTHIVGTTTGPMITIQNAINAINTEITGVTIKIAEGTYMEHLTISKNLNLIGAGQDQTFIDGTHDGRVITLSSNKNVNITGVTIQNGSTGTGAGIYNPSGNVTIINSTFAGNTVPSGSGGAIYNEYGTITLINSTLTGNSATSGSGGAIATIYGTVTLNNSTLTENNASNNGGAIYNVYATVNITNSTLTGNTATSGGAIYNNNGAAVTLHFNRIVSNSPNAIWTNAAINATYNWWGSNLDPSGQYAGTGTVNYSPWLYMTFTGLPTLILNGTTSTLTANFNNAYNGTNITALNPTNGHLPDGCAVTFTTDLGSVGSKSTIKSTINGIATATLTADELAGIAHVSAALDNQNSTTTVGIYDNNNRYVNAATGNDTYDGTSPTYISGLIGPMKTIQTAINAVSTGRTVYVASGTYQEHLTIIKSLNLIGTGQNQTFIDGTNNGRVITISNGPTINITGVTIRNGNTTGSGGALYNPSNVAVTIINSTLTGNTASSDGGAIDNYGTLTIISSTLTGNTAINSYSYGGAIYHSSGTVTIINSTLTCNTAYDGGAICHSSGTVTITNSTLTGNNATNKGGAISNGGTLVTINSTLTGNTATNGGAISNGGTLTINNSTLTGNRASSYGGAIEFSAGTITINNSSLTGNTAYEGGAIRSYYGGTLSINNSSLIGNSATDGGAIYSTLSGALNITNSTLTGNTVSRDGGALRIFNTAVNMHFNRVVSNSPNAIWTYSVIDAQNNWWGSNLDPSSQFAGIGTVNYSPWMFMTFTADPTLILNGTTSALTVNFNNAYNGTDIVLIDPVNGHLPDGCVVTFTTDLGSVGSKTANKNTSNGTAMATLISDENPGTAHLSAQLDSQLLNVDVIIKPVRYVNGVTGNDSWDGSSPVWVIGLVGPMKTILAAVNAIGDDGTVNVASGIYSENIVFDKKIMLVGAGSGNTTLTPTSSGYNPILINEGGLGSSVSGFNITGTVGVAGILLNNVENTSIYNNTISGNTIGIAFNNAGNNTVSNVLLLNNGAAVQIYRSNLNSISNSTFTSNDYGIYLLEGNNNTISNSLFTVTNTNGRAFYLESGQGNQVINNNITGGVYGVESLNDYENTYAGNDISGTAWRNMYITNSVQDVISGNWIHDTINGLLLLGGSGNQLIGNILYGCGSGLEVVNSHNNTLNNNNISQNTFGMYIYGNTGTNVTQNNVTGCGSAIELHESSENIINLNILVQNTFGVYIAGGLLNMVVDNVVFDTLYGGAGVHLENTSSNIINNNSFTNDVMDFRYGIYVNLGLNNNVTNNNASNNHAGLEMHNSNMNRATGNNLSNNTVGLFIDSSNSNIFTTNTINSNGAGVEMHSSHQNTFNDLDIANNTFGFIVFSGNNNTIINSVFNNNGAAINLQTCINSTIDSNQMSNNSYGVYILNGDHNLVQNSQITDIKLDGSGVFLDNTTQNTVKENSFINAVKLFTYGIYQTGGSNNTLESNTGIRNHAGIELHNTDNNNIVLNQLSYNTLGVFMWAGLQNNVTNNLINNNGAGIEIHQATQNNITGNNITDNVYGFYLDQLTSSNIKGNNLNTNTVGLYSENSNSNEIYTNNFSSNTTQAYDTGTNNYDNGVSTGNYWSDYSGIGPYSILGGFNVDYYPTNTSF